MNFSIDRLPLKPFAYLFAISINFPLIIAPYLNRVKMMSPEWSLEFAEWPEVTRSQIRWISSFRNDICWIFDGILTNIQCRLRWFLEPFVIEIILSTIRHSKSMSLIVNWLFPSTFLRLVMFSSRCFSPIWYHTLLYTLAAGVEHLIIILLRQSLIPNGYISRILNVSAAKMPLRHDN